MNKLLVLGLSLTLAAVACGADDSNSPDTGGSAGSSPSGEPIDAETFPARYAELFCTAQSKCCGAAGGERSPSCSADVADAARRGLETLLAPEHTEFARARASGCLGALAAVESCAAAWLTVTVSCERVVGGTLAAGEPCDSAEQCAAPVVGYSGCGAPADGSDKRCRQFLATLGAGEECFDQSAAPFAGSEQQVTVCKSGHSCVEGTCVAGASLGEKCGNGEAQCGEGTCVDGTCQQASLGESCAPGGASCEIGTTCSDGLCVQQPLFEQIGQEHACSVEP